jgi:glycosyltransferase involved in cell wall biosynthesis
VSESGLDVRLDTPLPQALPAGARTVLFVLGTCFHRELGVRAIEIDAAGRRTAATAHGMPRLDLWQALHPLGGAVNGGGPPSDEDPELRGYRSGFWATVPVEVPASGELELSLRAELADGSTEEESLGAIGVGAPTPPGSSARPPTVAIAMATFDPDPELFRRQVESISAQTFTDWACVISDDSSSPDALRMIEETIAGDERFRLAHGERRLGFYRNFERALTLTPPDSPYVALSDQDDRWHPEKLETLLAEIGDAQLVYSDQRVVDRDGHLISDTYWNGRRNNHTNLTSLLITNTVTGAASLFRREVVDRALPLPETPRLQYHDQWLALVALSTGGIAYVDRPLYDYVQHDAAALGHAAANAGAFSTRISTIARRVARGNWRTLVRGWCGAYFDYCRVRQLAQILLLRCGDTLSGSSRRALRRFSSAERSPAAFAWLALRRLRTIAGRDETLGAEGLLVRGIAWRYIMSAIAAGRRRPAGWAAYDASLPSPDPARMTALEHEPAQALARQVAPLELSVSSAAPERVNVLVPTIELKHLFAGYITIFNLARKLAERGHRARILTVDETRPLPRSWRSQVESYAGLGGVFDEIEVAFARDRDAPVEVNPADRFIATTWWTAHIADAALRTLEASRFLYLIQEYEPSTMSWWGSWAAVADESYRLPHVAMFSTELLRDFFAARGYGVFAAGREEGLADSLAFRNAITAVSPPPEAELARRSGGRLLFYARPEPHAARNMFDLGVLGLTEAISRGTLGPDWELNGIGSVEGADSIRLGPASTLELLPRRPQREYGDLLAAHDVGLALMLTPHPSLAPIEMAAAGMPTVTNTFETKTAGAIEALSGNLIPVAPTVEAIADGLAEAVRRSADPSGRIAGAAVDWPSDWNEALGPDVMRRVEELLAAC